jgi:integrase
MTPTRRIRYPWSAAVAPYLDLVAPRIGPNPAAGVRLPRQVRSEPRFLTAVEVAKLAAVAGPSGYAVLVLSFTGLRFGELAALKVKRVHVERRRLSVGDRCAWATGVTASSILPARRSALVG